LIDQKKLYLILQHPHSTDSVRTWSNALAKIEQCLPNPRYSFARAGCHYNLRGGRVRNNINDVRIATKKNCTTWDFIVKLKKD